MKKTRGGLVVLFKHFPARMWLALTCAKHRNWAIEWVVTDHELSLPAGRAVVLNVVVETMMISAGRHLDSCPCAKLPRVPR